MVQRDDWNLVMVQAAEALGRLPAGSDGRVDWGPLRVGFVDTGYTPHPIFGDLGAGTSWLRPTDGLNLCEVGEPPIDPLTYEGSPGHGTRIASVICGDARRLKTPPASVVGTAPGVPLVPCRVVNSVILTGERNRTAVSAGIRHAMAKGCQVVSISLGTPTFPWRSGRMGHAVDAAYEAGVIVVAAGGQMVDRVTYPGKFNRTIGCGGVTSQRRVWHDYAHADDCIDVWAPAEAVFRAEPAVPPGTQPFAPVEGDDAGAFATDGAPPAGDGTFGKGAGTSYATAHVAAAAAIWLRHHGSLLDQTYGPGWPRVEAFRLLLRRTAGTLFGGTLRSKGAGVLAIADLLRHDLPTPTELRMATHDRNKFA